MSYIKAADILPQEIVEMIQRYIDGGYIYIPRKEANRKAWGENTRSRELLRERNEAIYKDYAGGMPISRLSEAYYLSPKSIQKIIAGYK